MHSIIALHALSAVLVSPLDATHSPDLAARGAAKHRSIEKTPGSAARSGGIDIGSDIAAPTSRQRALDAGEFASLRSGVPAVSVAIDLPGFGAVRLEVVRTELVSDDFTVETAAKVRGTVVARALPIELPDAYAGRVQGIEDSDVFLGFGRGAGAEIIAGTIRVGSDTWWISSGPIDARKRGLPPMIAHSSTMADRPLDGLSCGAGALKPPFGAGEAGGEGGVAGQSVCREFRLAIETDTEFTMVAQGGNVVAAAQYALLLLGAASQVYDRDVGVRLPVSYLRLWTGEDIWTGADMFEQLTQYRDYWAANMGSVSRDLGHYLAGRGLGGGVAWLGVACTDYNWSYALSSGIGYGFPYPLVHHSHSNWEPMVVNHELGHNFGAPHTHDHNPQADGCGTNDCSQAFGGTIMSYCHGCPGGMSNVVMKFHSFSVDSMLGHLGNVGCVNAGARAVDDAATTFAGGPVEISPLENDAFVNCSAVSIHAFETSSASGGAVSLAAGPTTRLRYTPPAEFSGTDSFTYAIRDSQGEFSTATIYIEVLPLVQQVFVDGAQPGVFTRWYALEGETGMLPDFSAMTPYGTTVLPKVDIASTGGNFSTSGRADSVAAAFEGYLSVPSTGLWTLSVESDDGSRLFIGDTAVVQNDGLHGMVERSAQVVLEAGMHPIRIEFFENFGGAGCIARWSGPGTARAAIPAEALRWGGTRMSIDLDGDGTVASPDLGVLLSAWGPALPGTPADFDRNGSVDSADLARILSAWGQ